MLALIPTPPKPTVTATCAVLFSFGLHGWLKHKNQISYQSKHFYTVIQKSPLFPNALLKDHKLKELYFSPYCEGKKYICPVRDIHISELHVFVCAVFLGYNSTNAICEKQHDSPYYSQIKRTANRHKYIQYMYCTVYTLVGLPFHIIFYLILIRLIHNRIMFILTDTVIFKDRVSVIWNNCLDKYSGKQINH